MRHHQALPQRRPQRRRKMQRKAFKRLLKAAKPAAPHTRQPTRLLRRQLLEHEHIGMLLIAVVIGLVTGFAAVGMRLLIEAVQHGFAMLPQWSVQFLGWRVPGVVLAPALGGLIVGPIIYRFAKEARGHGVPEVMAAVLARNGFIRPRVAWIKALTAAITIGSGGSVGREGPAIQIGASIGSTCGYLLRLPPRIMRTFVASGAAGGIAAAFNAPIAGSLFAVEVILGDFGFVRFAPIVTSAVIATVVARGIEGDLAAFAITTDYSLEHPVELFAYVAVGLACGLAAVAFIRFLDRLERFFEDKLPLHPAWQPACGGLLVGMIGVFLPQIFGVGYHTIDAALHGELPATLLLTLVVAKLLATSITLASGGSGGVFAPSLFMGAMLGGAIGLLADQVLPVATSGSGAYALVGMGAMVGATTHAPITAIVIIFEMTNDYKIILPLMISTSIAVLCSSYLKRESIYTDKLQRKGIPLERSFSKNLLKSLRVRDIMRRRFDRLPHDLPFHFLIDQLLTSSRDRLPVVDDENRLLGVIPRTLAAKLLGQRESLAELILAVDLVEKDAHCIFPEQTLDVAQRRFREHGLRELYVVSDPTERRLLGSIHKGDLLDAYQKQLYKLEAGEIFAYQLEQTSGQHTNKIMPLMEPYGIVELESAPQFAEKTLRGLDLTHRYRVQVLALKRGADEGTAQISMPQSDDRLQHGDLLVLMGEIEHLQKLLAEGW